MCSSAVRAESEHPKPAKCGFAVDLTGADDCGAAQSLTYFCPNRSLRGQSRGNWVSPFVHGLSQSFQTNRLGHVVIHSGQQTSFAVPFHGVGCECYDRDMA